MQGIISDHQWPSPLFICSLGGTEVWLTDPSGWIQGGSWWMLWCFSILLSHGSFCWCLWRLALSLTYLWGGENRRKDRTGLGSKHPLCEDKKRSLGRRCECCLAHFVCCQMPFYISNSSVQAVSLKIKMGNVLVYINEYANRQIWGFFDFESLNQMRIVSTLHRGSKTELGQLIFW